MNFFRVAAATLISISLASQLNAQDITLTSQDGKVEISGNLLGFDGEFYRVDTQFGELTVDGSGVTCEGPACPSLIDFVAEVRFAGSSVMAERVLPALIVGFAQQEGLSATPHLLDSGEFTYELHQSRRDAPLGRFLFRPGNTGAGFSDLIIDEADIVMASREIRPSEQEAVQAAGLGDLVKARRSRVIALDALVPIVAQDNPVRQISPDELVQVFSGEISNWSELGGPDAPVSLHLPDAGSGLAQGVEDQLLAPASAALAENTERYTRSSDLVRAVANDPFAIGIASHAQLGTARALPLTGGCGHALMATRQSIKTEDYPLTSPLFLYPAGNSAAPDRASVSRLYSKRRGADGHSNSGFCGSDP